MLVKRNLRLHGERSVYVLALAVVAFAELATASLTATPHSHPQRPGVPLAQLLHPAYGASRSLIF